MELPLMELFYSIQGEGFHQGKAAVFIRLGGCDVGCPWCDVKDSWDADKWPLKTPSQIASLAAENPSRLAIITGGEPLMHDLTELTESLKRVGFNTHLETSGAYSLSGTWDWICFSPKKFKNPLPEFLSLASELKIIVYNKSDFDWGEQFAKKINRNCKLFLQPEWGKYEKVVPLIADYVKDNPKWEISLQIHKFMHVP